MPPEIHHSSLSNELTQYASTRIQPSTTYYWDRKNCVSVKVVDLPQEYHLIRSTKAFHLLKQDEEMQETWDSNLRNLNQYLADKFQQFHLSQTYVNEVTAETVPQQEEGRKLLREADELTQEASKLSKEKEEARQYIDLLDDDRSKRYESRFEELSEKEKQCLNRLKEIRDEMENLQNFVSTFEENGVMQAYLFSFSTDPRITKEENLETVVQDLIEEAESLANRKIKQTLTGSNFKLKIEEIESPRILFTAHCSSLYNPENLADLSQEIQGTELVESLEKVREENVKQFTPYALEDIQSRGFSERAKATPARSVNSLLQDLPNSETVTPVDLPQEGPCIGYKRQSKLSFGIDPAEQEHFYIVGGTGSGKSYLKRILIENCIDKEYDVVAVNPSDRQILSAAFANDNLDTFNRSDQTVNPSQARGIPGDYYLPQSQYLLDLPDDLSELFTGASMVSLETLSTSETEKFVTNLFGELYETRDRARDLFVFLDEAHKLSEGKPAEAIQDVIREMRKFNIHVVLSTQSPMDFTRGQKQVRENLTGKFFLAGEYTDYASKFQLHNEITSLSTGQAIYHHRDVDPFKFQVRTPLSKVEELEDHSLLEELDEMYQHGTNLDFKGKRNSGTITLEEDEEESTDLTDDEAELLDFIQEYVETENQAPSESNCHREGPFSNTKNKPLLENLVEKGLVTRETEERYGNESTVYYPTEVA
jgi:hypothetical protein